MSIASEATRDEPLARVPNGPGAGRMLVRDACPRDAERLARVWFECWHDGHARLLPPDIVRPRTLDVFRTRLVGELPSMRVVGPVGRPVGLCAAQEDELVQLHVHRTARGSDAATTLERDATRRLRKRGTRRAWLVCAIGNVRAAAFYERQGWRRAGTMAFDLGGFARPARIEVWRYEKDLWRGDPSRRRLVRASRRSRR